jgi:hypothetical protein
MTKPIGWPGGYMQSREKARAKIIAKAAPDLIRALEDIAKMGHGGACARAQQMLAEVQRRIKDAGFSEDEDLVCMGSNPR